MANRNRKAQDRHTTLKATLLTFVLAVAIPWGPPLLGCELDTTPKILPHPPVVRAPDDVDDNDSGESK